MPTEIISGLWIGNVDVMYNKKFLQDNNITIILNCTTNYKFSDYTDTKNISLHIKVFKKAPRCICSNVLY